MEMIMVEQQAMSAVARFPAGPDDAVPTLAGGASCWPVSGLAEPALATFPASSDASGMCARTKARGFVR
jgi:hypothetical protein